MYRERESHLCVVLLLYLFCINSNNIIIITPSPPSFSPP